MLLVLHIGEPGEENGAVHLHKQWGADSRTGSEWTDPAAGKH